MKDHTPNTYENIKSECNKLPPPKRKPNIRSWLWSKLSKAYPAYLRKVYGMHIGEDCRIARSAHLDKSINPKGIHIGNNVWVLREAMILAHDYCRGIKCDVTIGDDCVIGIRSIIMPGVTLGKEVVIGSGSIVTKDIPDNCVAVGNPAKVIKTGIHVRKGKIEP